MAHFFMSTSFKGFLLTSVQMVFASTHENTSIEELTQLADRIIEVAVPPLVSNVSTQPSELDLLKSEITSLTQVVNSLQRNYRSNSRSCYSSNRHRSPSPASRPHPPPKQSGITGTLAILHTNAHLPAPSQEMIRPAADGS